MRLKPIYILPILLIAFTSIKAQQKTTDSQMFNEFRSPGSEARPLTFWHWANGNVTKDGITKDFEAMKAAGGNGTFLFDVSFFPAGPVSFMGKEWWDDVAHAIKEADRLKMKFGVFNSSGWSMTGGPWITPEESMKQLAWKDTVVQGGKPLRIKLAQPTVNLIYHDISVMAFPAIANEKRILPAKIVSSELMENQEAAFDNDTKTLVGFLKPQGNKIANMVIDFGHEVTLRRIVFDQVNSNPSTEQFANLEYSNDGTTFTKIDEDFPLNLKIESLVQQLTFNFNKINARYIRLKLTLDPVDRGPLGALRGKVTFGEIKFYQSPRVNLWEPKSGQSKRISHSKQPIFIKELSTDANENLTTGELIATSSQINLTDKLDKDGNLNWTPPAGQWIIQRVGYTSTGRVIAPATAEGRGLECDKMDAKVAEKHFNAYVGKIADLSQKLVGRPIDYMLMESWEAGIQNWTKGFDEAFQKQNGYSIIPFLPVLAGGYVVNSYAESNKFLWDFRNTCAQLIADNYWQTMVKCAKAKGMSVTGEASGMQHYLYDAMRYHQFVDMPTGEMWPNEGHPRVDVKNASSVANTYGKTLVGAESFTNGGNNMWSITPFKLKQIGDEAFTMGLNQIILHTYVHQPYDVGPGFTLGRFGTHLQRLNPWYSHSQGWFNYLTRCSYLLRQGKGVQDIAYFIGEGAPSYLGMRNELRPELPNGYDYDGVNTDIINRMTVKDGKLYLPTGAKYNVLVFQNITLMTPELAKKVKALVADGATVISLKPQGSPSLMGGPVSDKLVKAIGDEVWGNIDSKHVTEHSYGKGKIYSGVSVAEVLKKQNLQPDFLYTVLNGKPNINFVHRKTDDTDIYFIANYERTVAKIRAQFRVDGKVPELWDPDKGTRKVLPYRVLPDKHIEVTLSFDPAGAMFVVFAAPIVGKSITEAPLKVLRTYPLDGVWNVAFQSRTDTINTVFKTLSDWAKNEDERIKYFSGTATYIQNITLDKTSATAIELNLGNTYNFNLATVMLNGKKVADLWKPPYKTDITDFVRNGNNLLQITVTNTATNSLVGDERYPEDLSYNVNNVLNKMPTWLANPKQRPGKRINFVTHRSITKNSKLDSSGLVGPVTIIMSK